MKNKLQFARSWTRRQIPRVNRSLHVLVVDDYRVGADSLSAYFMAEGLECQVAYGGREGVEMAVDWAPDVIVMDVSMPECNGYDAALSIRSNKHTEDIFIVAFSALDESEVRRSISDHEFDAYCRKGQSPLLLLDLIRAASIRE
jgi:CheY-like chemotaxis protein